jgi:hypothetical protein
VARRAATTDEPLVLDPPRSEVTEEGMAGSGEPGARCSDTRSWLGACSEAAVPVVSARARGTPECRVRGGGAGTVPVGAAGAVSR